MFPTAAMQLELQSILAADVGSLAAATAMHVHLIKAPFNSDRNTDFTTLTEADFNTYAALAAGTGTQQSFNDPVTGQLVVQVKEPAGGWHWQAGSGLNLPQTIYGWVITDTANAVTWGSELFNPAITLLATGDGVDLAEVRFEFKSPPMV